MRPRPSWEEPFEAVGEWEKGDLRVEESREILGVRGVLRALPPSPLPRSRSKFAGNSRATTATIDAKQNWKRSSANGRCLTEITTAASSPLRLSSGSLAVQIQPNSA